MAVTGGCCCCFLFDKKSVKRSVQCHLFARTPPDRRHSDKYPVNTLHRSDLCKNVSLQCCQSQWPRGLRRRSTAVRLLGSWVRIPPGAWTFVYCECCVCCQVEVSVRSWPLVQGSPTDCGASLSVTSKPHE